MEIGRAQIVVAMQMAIVSVIMIRGMMVVMFMVMLVMSVRVAMIMIAAQKPRARDVDQEPDHRDRNGFVELDRDRAVEPGERLIADRQSDHAEDHGAAEAR